MTIRIPLTQGYHALIDDEDEDLVRPYKWHIHAGSAQHIYATSAVAGKRIWMHRLIMRTPEHLVVDHISGDTLDNRKANLRNVTQAINCMNAPMRPLGITGFRGVQYRGDRDRFIVVARDADGRQHRYGSFKTAEEAARRYDEVVRRLHGPLAQTNFKDHTMLDIPCNTVFHADALTVLRKMQGNSVSLIYADPPWNTGHNQRMIRTVNHGEFVSEFEYADVHINFRSWLMEIITEARRVLTHIGSIYLHLDYHEVHYIKVAMDALFGEESFINELIWHWDFGARAKRYWPRKHSTILWYVKDPRNYIFNYEDLDRMPYMTPELVGPEKTERGKTPTDVWWNSIVGTNSRERTGYASQKPLPIVERIIRASSHPGDLVMDMFAGSGTTGEAAYKHGRRFALADTNPQAISVMRQRFTRVGIPDDAIDWVRYE